MADGGVLEVVLEGHHLTQQLESYLNGCYSVDYCRAMVHDILAAWKKLMFMANPIADSNLCPLAQLESPDQQSFSVQEQPSQKPGKKRKTSLPTWTSQFRACSPGAGADDGYNWRKYGQKEILGFKEPRCYYRCSHRYSQKCPATKYIQRSEHDPSIYDVIYHGTHTCVMKSKRKASPRTAEDIPANPYFDLHILQSFKTGLRVQTEDLPGVDPEAPSTCASGSYLTPTFSTPSPLAEGSFAFSGSFSSFSPFVSPTAVSADEPWNLSCVEPFLVGHESQGAKKAASSIVPPAIVDTAMAGLEFEDDVLFGLEKDFSDLISHEL